MGPRNLLLVYLAGACLFVATAQVAADEPPSGLAWRKHTINDRSPYEAAGAADFNGDGLLDVFCGDSWYQAPNWTRQIGEVLVVMRIPTGRQRADLVPVPLRGLVPGIAAEDVQQPIAVEVGGSGGLIRRTVVDRVLSPATIARLVVRCDLSSRNEKTHTRQVDEEKVSRSHRFLSGQMKTDVGTLTL